MHTLFKNIKNIIPSIPMGEFYVSFSGANQVLYTGRKNFVMIVVPNESDSNWELQSRYFLLLALYFFSHINKLALEGEQVLQSFLLYYEHALIVGTLQFFFNILYFILNSNDFYVIFPLSNILFSDQLFSLIILQKFMDVITII